MSKKSKPSVIVTTKEFDFGYFYEILQKNNQVQTIIDSNADLNFLCSSYEELIKADYKKYSRIYLFKDDPSFKDLAFNCNFNKENILTVLFTS